MDILYTLLAIYVFVIVYFLPTLITAARRKSSRYTTKMFVLNLLFGWTVIIWFAALVGTLRNEGPDEDSKEENAS